MLDAIAQHLDISRSELDHLITIGAIPRTAELGTARRAYIRHLRERAVRRACRRAGVEGVLDDLLGSLAPDE